MFRDTPFTYGLFSKSLHWIIAVLIILNLGFGLGFDFMPREMRGLIMPVHKSVGALVLILMVVRLSWRVDGGFAKLPATIPVREQKLARWVHVAFYPLLILMPLSGWLMSSAADRTTSFFGLFDLPRVIAPDQGLREFFGGMHDILGWAILALVVGHAGAAVYHHYWRRTKFIRRMT